MSNTIERFAIWSVRTVINIIINTLILLFTAWIIPGIEFVDTVLGPAWLQAVAAAIVLGLINLLLRPVVLWISRPLGFFLLFGVGYALNIVGIYLAAWLLPGFEVDNFLSVIVASLLANTVNILISSIINLGDADSYYRKRTLDKAAEQPFDTAIEDGRNLMMVEIDGLSYHHMKHALREGLLPTLQEMIDEDDYVLSLVDCGIPSQTSACQAGIMFGDNYDIPAFRWYDKTQGKLIVSSSDAGELNDRYAHGQGLMRGGTSVSNMVSGDAFKSMMTASDLTDAGPEGKQTARRRCLSLDARSFLPGGHHRPLSGYGGRRTVGRMAAEAQESVAAAQPPARFLPVCPRGHVGVLA